MSHFKVLLYVLLLLCVSPSIEAATWSGLETLETSSDYPDSSVAVDPQGNAVAVFIKYDDSQLWIMGTRRLVGGDWSTPVPIVPAIPYNEGSYISPAVVMDFQGNAVVVWNVHDNGNNLTTYTQGATLSINSDTWVPSQTLSRLIRVLWEPHLTCDAQGNATAAWEEWDEDQILQIATARYNASTKKWTLLQPVQLSCDDVYEINLDVDDVGRAVMTWSEYYGPVSNVLKASTLAVNGTQWGPAQTLYDGRVTDNVVHGAQLAVDAKGNAVVVWVTLSADEHYYTLNACKRAFNSATWKLVQCPDVAVDWFLLKLAIDPSGNALLIYRRDDVPFILMSSQLTSSSYSWTVPVTVSPNGNKIHVSAFGVDRSGNAIVMWADEVTGRLLATTLPYGNKEWASPTTVASNKASYSSLDLALDAQGNCVAICSDMTNFPNFTVKSTIGQNLFTKAKKKPRRQLQAMSEPR